MRHHCIPTRMANTGLFETPSFGRMQSNWNFHTSGENTKWENYPGKQAVSCNFIKLQIHLQQSHSCIYPRKMKKLCSLKNLYMNVHSSSIHNPQNKEHTKCNG